MIHRLRTKAVVFSSACLVLSSLPIGSAALAQSNTGYRPVDAGCELRKNVKDRTQEIRPPQRGGILFATEFDYHDANPGEPYRRATFSGERLAFGNKAKANLDVQFTLAGMVLDAGHRYFEPGAIRGQQGSSAGQFGGNLFGTSNDRILIGTVFFCDAPAKYTQDAVEVYNRLGAQLLGARFQPRSKPSPKVLMWKDPNTIRRW